MEKLFTKRRVCSVLIAIVMFGFAMSGIAFAENVNIQKTVSINKNGGCSYKVIWVNSQGNYQPSTFRGSIKISKGSYENCWKIKFNGTNFTTDYRVTSSQFSPDMSYTLGRSTFTYTTADGINYKVVRIGKTSDGGSRFKVTITGNLE